MLFPDRAAFDPRDFVARLVPARDLARPLNGFVHGDLDPVAGRLVGCLDVPFVRGRAALETDSIRRALVFVGEGSCVEHGGLSRAFEERIVVLDSRPGDIVGLLDGEGWPPMFRVGHVEGEVPSLEGNRRNRRGLCVLSGRSRRGLARLVGAKLEGAIVERRERRGHREAIT